MKLFLLVINALIVGALIAVIQGSQSSIKIDNHSETSYSSPTLETTYKPTIIQDPELVTKLQSIGATNLDKLTIRYSDHLPVDWAIAYYTSHYDNDKNFTYGEMLVKPEIDGVELNRVLAHEYLHHIWASTLNQQTQQKLISHLITLYSNDTWMKNRLYMYRDSENLTPFELFSFYCTEESDQYLDEYVLGICNKYINRNTLNFLK